MGNSIEMVSANHDYANQSEKKLGKTCHYTAGGDHALNTAENVLHSRQS